MKKAGLIILGVILGSLVFAQTTMFYDNFDEFSTSSGIASQSDNWETWTSPSGGGANDAFISTEQAYSNTQSMLIDNDKDMVYQFDEIHSGNIGIEFWFYIPDDKGGYFNVQHQFMYNWAFSMYFLENDAVAFTNGMDSTQLATYTPDAWNKMFLEIDIDSDELSVVLNETEIGSFVFHYSLSGYHSSVLDCINFYGMSGLASLSNSEMYIDDFKVIEIESPLDDPTVLSTTESISSHGEIGSFSIENVGGQPLQYRSYVVYDDHDTFTGELEEKYLTHWVDSIEASYEYSERSDGSVYEILVRFLPEDLEGFIGMDIQQLELNTESGYRGDSVYVIFREPAGVFNVENLGFQVYSELYTNVTPHTEYTFGLGDSQKINGEEIILGVRGISQGFDSVLVSGQEVESSGIIDHRNFMSNYDGTGYIFCLHNLYIKAVVRGYAWPEWVSVTPKDGIINAGQSQNFNVLFDTGNLEPDETYTATIVVATNDGHHEFVEIPVTLDVVNGITDAEKIGVLGYPNPVSDVFHVESESEIESISIINMNGQLVSTLHINNTLADVQLKDLPAGIYQLLINLEKQSVVKKIVKE